MSQLADRPPAPDADQLRRERLESRVDTLHPCPCCGEVMIYTPLIQCSHCSKPMEIKCYVYRKGGRFYAECLTLNLISRGDTQEEAILRLQRSMFAYVEAAFRDGQSVKDLIPRSAPLASWARYYAYRLARKLSASIGQPQPLATKSTPAPDATQYRFAEC